MRLSLSGFLPVLFFTGIFLAVLVAPVTGTMGSAMLNTDLFGPNIANKDVIPGNDGKAECVSWCENTPGCTGATWVAPGVQGTSARCWIKSEVSDILPNKNCCISWITQAAAQPSQYPVDIASTNMVGKEFIIDSDIRGTTPATINLEPGYHKISYPMEDSGSCVCPEDNETFFVSGAMKLTYDSWCYCYNQVPHFNVITPSPTPVPFIACPSDYQCISATDAVTRWGKGNLALYSSESCGGSSSGNVLYYCYRETVIVTTPEYYLTQVPHPTTLTPTQIPLPHYSVEVRSNPTGAQLTVDSKVWGNTPVTITAEKGNHQVLLQKAGYRDYSATVSLSGEKELVYTLVPEETITAGTQNPHTPTTQTPQSVQTPHTTSGPPASPFVILAIIILFAIIRRRRDA